jgi:hypothetical protein
MMDLNSCPRCGKPEGELVDAGARRFPCFVICNACQFTTTHARTLGIAAKLWNEAKPAKEKPARSGRRGGS